MDIDAPIYIKYISSELIYISSVLLSKTVVGIRVPVVLVRVFGIVVNIINIDVSSSDFVNSVVVLVSVFIESGLVHFTVV